MYYYWLVSVMTSLRVLSGCTIIGKFGMYYFEITSVKEGKWGEPGINT